MRSNHRKRPILESWALLYPPPSPPVGVPTAIPVEQEEATPPPPRRPRAGFFDIFLASIAWLAIAFLVLFALAVQFAGIPSDTRGRKAKKPEGETVTQAVYRLQLRFLVGLDQLADQPDENYLKQLESLKTSDADGHIAYIIAVGEFGGPAKARGAITEWRRDFDGKPHHRRLIDILDRLYGDYQKLKFDAPSVRQAERDYLIEKLRWVGELALAPKPPKLPKMAPVVIGGAGAAAADEIQQPDEQYRREVLSSATRVLLFLVFVGFTMLLLLFAGFVGLIVLLIAAANRIVRSNMYFKWGNGGVYAETFALYLLSFAGLSFLVDWGLGFLPDLVRMATPGVLSLLLLFWPRLRGIPWATMRKEIGLTWGNRPGWNIFLGPGGYAMCLPIFLVGLLLTLILMAFVSQLLPPERSYGDSPAPVHPIQPYLVSADVWRVIGVLFIASVVAPITEEIFFRGMLYRNLRGLFASLGTGWAMIVSGLISSFIFAAIHPQGIVAIPALASLGFGFCLLREWRGSLVPSMIAHGVHNGVLLTVSLVALS